jgi:hypothetical protein
MKDELDPIYARALRLIVHFEDEFLELASLVRKLYETNSDEFKTLIAQQHLGRRKAYYLVEVDRAFGDIANEQCVRLNEIGWTKLATIAASITHKNREKLLKLAEAHTVEDIKALVRGETPVTDRKTIVLYFTPKQHEKFAKVILKHGAIKSGDGFAKKEEALIAALAWK